MALLDNISLQHPSNRQSTLPFASFCRFGARASPAGAGGGGQGSSELEAPGEGGGQGTSPELEAPGQGGEGEEDMAGEKGWDIVKMPEGAGECQESPQTSFPYAPGGFSPR
jgi:hypothetical protein